MFLILFAISQSICANGIGPRPTAHYGVYSKKNISYFSAYSDIGLILNMGSNAGHAVSMNWTVSAGKQFSQFYIGGGFSVYSYTQYDERYHFFSNYPDQSYHYYEYINWRHTALDLFADYRWNIHSFNVWKGELIPILGMKIGCGIGSVSKNEVQSLFLFVCRPSIGLNYCINSRFQHEVGINFEYIPFNNFQLHGLALNIHYKFNLHKSRTL